MSSRGGSGRGPQRAPSPMGVVYSPHLLPKGPGNPAQTKVDVFWSRFTTRNPGKATTLLPRNELAERLSKRTAAKDLAGGASKTTAISYEEAAAACRAKVEQIVLECRRVNQKYRDPHFDLDYDLKSGQRNCLVGLSNAFFDYQAPAPDYSSGCDSSDNGSTRSRRKKKQKKPVRDVERSRSAYLLHGERAGAGKRKRPGKERKGVPGGFESDADDDGDFDSRVKLDKLGAFPGAHFNPRSVKRVGDIFDDPKFYIEGPTANDIRQGADGDCWFMAALCTLTNKRGLVEKVCVARDEKIGVYGFVFYRDGEWVSEIIDDKLYLKKPDYDEKRSTERQRNLDRELWDEMDHRQEPDEHYRKTYQANSSALYFAQCEHPNETWLPLLEKAYAKAHGDYAAIDGGFTGEGIEDLTGGVTSELFTADILDTEHFWKEGLLKVNDEFLFGCSTGDWRGYGDRRGIRERHAYSVLRAVEIDGERLVLLKNPWGKGEWQGAWSDGSKEWTAEWLQKLNHSFGDDGAFWMSYRDLLRKYQHFDRTRLFDDDKWKVTSMWTTLNVSWAPDYHDTKFSFTLEKSGPVVIVLSQLDDRYFRGFEGSYTFGIGFRLHKAGEKEYLVRTQTTYRMTRSCNVELNLEAGEYTVLVKVDARRWVSQLAAEDVIKLNARYRREKVLRIAMAYDLAHTKAQVVETPEEKEAREKHEKRQKEKYRKKIRKVVMEDRQRQHQHECRLVKMERKRRAHRCAWGKQHFEKQEAKRKAADEAQQKEWEQEQAEKRSVGSNKGGSVKGEVPENEGQPEANAKVENAEGKPAETDAADPEASTDVGENTPSASTNSASGATVEKAPEEEAIDGVPAEEKTGEEKPAEKETPEEKAPADKNPDEQSSSVHKATKVEDDDVETTPEVEANSDTQTTFVTAVAEQNSAQEEAEQSPQTSTKDAAVQAPAPASHNEDPRILELRHRVKRALNVVSVVGKELHSILLDTQAAASERDTDASPTEGEQEEEAEEAKQPLASFGQQQPPIPHRHLPGPHQHFPAQYEHQLNDHQNLRPPPQASRNQRHPQHNRPPPGPASSYMDDMGPPVPRPRQSIPSRQQFRHHAPPPPPPQDFDSEPESIMDPCSPLEVSDAELDCLVKDNDQEAQRILRGPPPPPPPPSFGPGPVPGPLPRGRSPPPPQRSNGLYLDADEPWNAVAVVGLRVYYRVDEEGGKEKEGVKLKVVRPIYYDDSESEDEEEGKGKRKKDGDGEKNKEVEETKVLDVDDSAKDAIEEVEGSTKV
ncbi:calcium-dependent cysteine-type endopeptidase [Cladorrhinum sp. PSN259]|nr:calcium-dependent cysteine-type endopeptidase [Cladorrhinum sp. PSN259]